MKSLPSAALILACATFSFPLAAQTPAYKVPRTADGKPDFQGIWIARNAASFDVSEIAEGHEIPYLPDALERERNGPRVDPIANCSMPGVPRITYMPFPIQIMQRPGVVIFLYEYLHDFRLIQTTPRPHIEDLDLWLGDSVAKWDGDSLAVDVTNQRPETWLDSARHTHSEVLHVVERYTRTGPDVITYEATLDDSKTYSKPWKIAMPLHRITEPGFEIREQECAEGDSGRAIHPLYRPAGKQ
jgi:hypothetical protein